MALHVKIATLLGLAATLALPARIVVAKPIDIGVAAPLSGPDAIFGNQIRIGVEQAVEDANASGGFLGAPGRLVKGDDSNEPKRGVDVARSFVETKIGIVIGDFSSAVTIPASGIYAEANVLDITPSAIAPQVTDRGLGTVFRICGREDAQASVAAHFLAARYARVAILHDRTAPAKALADSVRSALQSDGKADVFYGSLEKGTRDFHALVGRLKASGAQAVFWAGTQVEGGLLVRQLHDAEARVVLLGGQGIASDEFASGAGAAAEGTLIVFPRDPRGRPEAAALTRRLAARGVTADGYAYYSYAAIQVVQQAMASTRATDPKKLAAAIHSGMTFQTVIGDLTFDAKGDAQPADYVVYAWHKGPAGHMTYDDIVGN